MFRFLNNLIMFFILCCLLGVVGHDAKVTQLDATAYSDEVGDSLASEG